MGPIMGTFLLELRHAVVVPFYLRVWETFLLELRHETFLLAVVPFYLKESMGDLFTGVRVWGILGVQVRVCAKGQVLVLLLLGQ